MLEAAFYIASSFWLGALHAATPGHGKTVAAAYLVGARGRVVDAIVLGIFVTLAHTGGIVAFGVLATLGSSALLPQQAEGYLALATGLLIVGLGLSMLWGQRRFVPFDRHATDEAQRDRDHDDGPRARDHGHGHEHHHGWGRPHTHRIDLAAAQRPSLKLLLGLGIAGGVAPDPAALAVLLSAIATGKLVLGLLTVLVFSLGFASVLVVVGLVAAKAGQLILDRLGGKRWLDRLQLATAVLIVGVGVVLTVGAWRIVTSSQ
jgi:nickel/cobalt transporter (NicO) family protein